MANNLCKKQKEIIQAANDEADHLNAKVEFEHNSKHPCMTVTFDNIKRKVALSCTSRTDNQVNWIRQHVRRLVKEIEKCQNK